MSRNTFARRLVVILAVVMLSLPSALGIQKRLEPTRGPIGSWSGAVGIEVLYLGIALLILSPELRVYARRVARGAVTAAVTLNVMFDYGEHMKAAGNARALNSATAFMSTFDWLILVVAVLESLPLAGLAYLGSELLTRVAASEHGAPMKAWRFPRLRLPERFAAFYFWRRLSNPSQSAVPPAAGTPSWSATDVARKALRGGVLDPGDEVLFRQELRGRKQSGESRHSTIASLFGVSSGAQYTKACDIYDRYIEKTNGAVPHV